MSGPLPNRRRVARLVTVGAGLLIVVAAAAFPGHFVIERFIAPREPTLVEPLRDGFRLFQVCLAAIGLAVCALGLFRRFLWGDDADLGDPLVAGVPDRRPMRTAWVVAAIGLLVVIGAVVRFRHVNMGFTYDEINAAEIFFNRQVTAVPITFSSSNNHIFYSLCANVSGRVFGQTHLGYRLPAIVFGIAAIGAIYFLTVQVASRRDGLLAAALIGLSYRHVWFSQEARGYTAMILFGALGLAQFIKALRTGRTRDWVLYGVAMLIAIYTHLFSVFLVAGPTVAYLCMAAVRRRLTSIRTRRVVVAGALIALGTCTLYSVVVPQMLAHYNHHLAVQSSHPLTFTWQYPVNVLHSFAVDSSYPLVTLAYALLALVGLISLAGASTGAALVLAMPGALAIAMLSAGGTVACERYLMFFLPVFLVLVARGVGRVSFGVGQLAFSRVGRRVVSGLAMACLLVGLLADPVRETVIYQDCGKQAFDRAARWLVRARNDGDRIIMVGLGKEKFLYYLDGAETVDTPAELQQRLRAPGTVWVAYTFPRRFAERQVPMLMTIREHCQSVLRLRGLRRWGDVEIWCRPADRAAATPRPKPPPRRPSRVRPRAAHPNILPA